ncbi:cystine ABC transporter substrate-binding protein [Glaciimonas immobilis]|uniref:Cystine transport system substrate-binding protein n=1 Tax=Glaciimonas immobilis TaxID=728004 RepID=A0A840RPI8_9BURK|nr:cystine ABC transporter substrate-binding protein [Glaciimonas immobilis]KAF3999114.1 cystine ABC transporter substrate-binding protein [Glaciimonas immobilis]MBB5198550.1 cystine transport system substrate-binding protein [Glaciimonas immobilis]
MTTAKFSTLTKMAAALLISSVTVSAFATDLLDTIKSRGILKVAMEGNYPPFNFKDPKTGQLTGFEVDVANLIAAKLGVKTEFTTTEWSGILAGLGANKYDVILNQVGITDERKKAFDFSVPYTISSAQLIIRKDEKRNFTSLEDLKGLKLGLGQGTNFEQKAKSVPGIDVKTYPGSPEYLSDLANGRIDAALNDSLLVGYLLKNTALPLKAGAPIGSIDKIGIPFQKGNPKFQAALDKAIEDTLKDGSFKKVSIKWFGIDVSKPPTAK